MTTIHEGPLAEARCDELRTIRIEVSYRPAYFNRVAFAVIPACYRAALVNGGRPDRLPTHDGETADEAVRLLCESHGLDPSRAEIVRRL